ncbi:MAG: tRNA (adenosine(37)-N6)-dimethylallyltransferase MiaA [Deltaproteobacteria bacterium]|nr:tRNA (adenosine(37)-N6)-dimethylallyltransferase MiaA [Deltaproteobacteria bacterium]
MDRPRLLVILGPTAIGKTSLAIEIARRINGAVISADSLQVYRYLDIGTAKPTKEEQAQVDHHLIDILDPDEEFNAGLFRNYANSIIRKLTKKRIKLIVVGGTYLYVRVLLHGLIEGVASNKEIRDRLRTLKSSFGVGYFYEKLKSLDPESALRIHSNDYVRIERALESYYITGQKISNLQKKHGFRNAEYHYLKLGLYDERDMLRKRIEDRVDSMIKNGLIEEVEMIRSMGFIPALKPLQSIGYRQINQYLDKKISLRTAVELMKRDTKRLAKRQMTWLKSDKEIKWYRLPEDLERLMNEAEAFYRLNG